MKFSKIYYIFRLSEIYNLERIYWFTMFTRDAYRLKLAILPNTDFYGI
jgi:hypothetical protein